MTERQKELRFYKSIGICPKCQKNKLFGVEKECPECAAKGYGYAMKSREKLGTEHYNKLHSEWARNEHQRRIEAGLCTRCGKRNADYGFKTCGICRDKDHRTRLQREPHKPSRKERYKQGLCYWCDEPIKLGYKVCEKHYQMNVEKQKKSSREKLREINSKMFLKY